MALQVSLIAGTLAAAARGPRWSPRLAPARRRAGAVLVASGGAFVAGTVLKLGRSFTPLPRPQPGLALRTDGVYELARHPGYSGLMQLGIGTALLTSPTALTRAALLTVVLALKTAREEAWLAERFDAYAAYRMRVRGRFVPRRPALAASRAEPASPAGP